MISLSIERKLENGKSHIASPLNVAMWFCANRHLTWTKLILFCLNHTGKLVQWIN